MRVGRLLAVAPVVSIAEARAFAEGPPRYVAIQGRIDAADEFEDEAHRPLVLRRARIQLGSRRGWRTIDEQREAVDFDVREGLDGIAIDQRRPRRRARRRAARVGRHRRRRPGPVPAGTPGSTPRCDCGSSRSPRSNMRSWSGVPAIDAADGTVRMTRRPRAAAHPHDPRTRRGDARPRRGMRRVDRSYAVVAHGASALVGLTRRGRSAAIARRRHRDRALAASPGPSAVVGGDPRSSGQGPGLVGDPADGRRAGRRHRRRWPSLATARLRADDGRPRRLTSDGRRTRRDLRPIGKNCEIGSLAAVDFTVLP